MSAGEVVNVPPPEGCTNRTSFDSHCGAPIPPGTPVTLCGAHLIAAYQFCVDSLQVADAAVQPDAHALTTPAVSKPSRHVVYYVARGDLIKIGTTTDLLTRMGTVQPDKILAVEPGDRTVEKERHWQFRCSRAHQMRGRELFQRTEDLLEHVEAVAAKYGRPAVSLMSEHHRWQRHVEEMLDALHI